ncbi:MAG: hypothetical protein ACI9LN_001963, partial [Saprospiraceae bacterium]
SELILIIPSSSSLVSMEQEISKSPLSAAAILNDLVSILLI